MRAENSRSRTLFQALTLSFLCFANPVQAQPGPVNYKMYSRPSAFPLYDLVFQSMKSVYALDIRLNEKGVAIPKDRHPLIFIATPSLSPNGGTFAIGKPVESGDDETPRFCKTWDICPHYILEKTAKGTKILGTIETAKIEVDNKVENGLYRLKAYQSGDTDTFSLYTYCKDTNGYVFTPVPLEKPQTDLRTP